MRQCGKVRREIRAVHLLERLASRTMEPREFRISRVFVKSFANQRMSEAIDLTRRGCDDANFTRFTHQLGERTGSQLADSLEQHDVEFLSDHGGYSQG